VGEGEKAACPEEKKQTLLNLGPEHRVMKTGRDQGQDKEKEKKEQVRRMSESREKKGKDASLAVLEGKAWLGKGENSGHREKTRAIKTKRMGRGKGPHKSLN